MLSVVASTLLMGCSSDDTDPKIQAQNRQLNIVVHDIATKSVKSTFVADDEIAVFVNGTGYTPVVTSYKYNGTNWSPSLGTDKGIMLTGNTANVYACYPADVTLNELTPNGTFDITTPETNDFAATSTSERLWATGTIASNLVPGTSNVSTLTFNHSLAKVSFILVSDGNYPVTNGSGVVTKIALSSSSSKIVKDGTVKISDGTFTPSATLVPSLTYTSGSTTVINAKGSSNIKAYCLVAPVNYTTGDLVLKITIDNKEMTVSNFPATPNWSAAGNDYQYTITVSPTELSVSNTTVIKDWIATPVGDVITAK